MKRTCLCILALLLAVFAAACGAAKPSVPETTTVQSTTAPTKHTTTAPATTAKPTTTGAVKTTALPTTVSSQNPISTTVAATKGSGNYAISGEWHLIQTTTVDNHTTMSHSIRISPSRGQTVREAATDPTRTTRPTTTRPTTTRPTTTKPVPTTYPDDPYDVFDYWDPEDFYYDHYDDFFDYYDAEDYFYEQWEPYD